MTSSDATQRFSDRVDNYVRFRPSYPQAIIDCLREEVGLTPDTVVADIGSGTGILTQLFLENGNTVHAIEPNDAMRAAAEGQLRAYAGFHSVNGTAEHTTLPDHSAGLVVAGQAFHWFDPVASRAEFGRVLRPGGIAALVWNMRLADAPGFMTDYEAMLQSFGRDYNEVKQSAHMGDIATLFNAEYQTRTFPNEQTFDYEGLKGRLLSSSYSPPPGHPLYEPMLVALQSLFDRYQQNGHVTFLYETRLYFGRIDR